MPKLGFFDGKKLWVTKFRFPLPSFVAGLLAASAASCFAEKAELPYLTSFESSEDFITGTIDGQLLWSSDNGALVTTVLANWGEQSVVLPASSIPVRASLDFSAAADFLVVYTDLYTLPIASLSPNAFIEIEGAKIAFVQTGPGKAELYSFNGNGAGGGSWEGTGRLLSVNPRGQSTTWLRLTVREDFSLQKWSLYLNAELIASGKGFVDAGKTGLSRLTFIGQDTGSSAFDDLLVGYDNPLFTDVNNNGVDDALETSEIPDGDLPGAKQPKPSTDGVDSTDSVYVPPVIGLPPRPPIISAALLRLQVYLPLRR